MKIITLLNEKGGVGKTTLSTHIAAGLAIEGLRVVLVDADAQSHATIGLGLKPKGGLYDLIVRPDETEFKDVLRVIEPEIYESPHERSQGLLTVIPSNAETMSIPNNTTNVLAIYQRFMELEGNFDVVIFDTSPTPSMLHGSIFLATDGVIFPTELEYFSLKALQSSLGHYRNFSEVRQDRRIGAISVLGIVPTRCRVKTIEHNVNYENLKKEHGNLVWDPMPLRITWAEAAMQRRTVFAYAPDSEAAAEAWNIVHLTKEALHHAEQA